MTVQKDDINGLAQKVQSSSSGNVLIVAHSDTLPGIVQKLGEATIASIGNTEYDRLLIVNIGGSNAATVTTLHYCHCESATPGSAIQGMHPQR
jgi:putative aminopeptidase FrvX